MKKTYLVLALLSSLNVVGAEVKTESPAPASFLDGIYIEALGVMRKPNITGKSEYGAGAEIGKAFNSKVAVGIQNIAYKTPDNWEGGAIDETSGVAHWTLFSNKKTSLGGLGSVTHSWREDAWALGAGAEIKHYFTKNVSAGIGAQIRFWNSGTAKEDLLVSGSVGYKF